MFPSFLSKLKKRKGFSLIELAVVFSLTIVLAATLVAYNRSTEGLVALSLEQAKVVGVLNQAKAYALQKNYEMGGSDVCGFGVHFEKPQTYFLFKDFCPLNKQLDNESEIIETFYLDKRVVFSELPCGGQSECSVVFEPPYLKTYNYGNIGLKLKQDPTNKEVFVSLNQGGSISKVRQDFSGSGPSSF